MIKKKGNRLYVKWKGYNNSFNSWIDKKTSYKMSQYFPPYRGHIADVKVRLDLTNSATKTDLKNLAHVDPSNFSLNTNLASLKTEADKLNIDKLKVVPTDLSKLSDIVKNDVVKKTEYNSLKTKVDNIDNTNFVKKTKYEADGVNLENKINDIKIIIEINNLMSVVFF